MIYQLTADLKAFSRDVEALERDFAAYKAQLAKAVSNQETGEANNLSGSDK